MTDNVNPKESKDIESTTPISNAETNNVPTEPVAGLDSSQQTMTENNSTVEPNDIEDDKPESTSDLSSLNSELRTERDGYLDRLQRKQEEFEN